jgi:hypothetical protein
MPAQISTIDLLDACERRPRETAASRVDRVLGLAWSAGELAGDTAGLRHRRVLELRRELAGSRWPCVTNCPACAALLDVELDVAEVLAAGGGGVDRQVAVAWGGETLTLRVPSWGELLAGARTAVGIDDAVNELIAACLLEGEIAAPIPLSLREAVEVAFEAADPLGVIALELRCPACGADAAPVVDLASLWADELDGYAAGLVAEVDALARAYGWSEREILALPASRRRAYLARIGA